LLALRTSPPVVTIAEAERIARESYGLAVSVAPLSGERDRNFHLRAADGREYVLKIFDAAADPQAIDCQVRVLRHLSEQDPALPVPRLFATLAGADTALVGRDGGDSAACLLQFLPGRLLSTLTPSAALLRNLGATFARIDQALQGFFHPALAQVLAWDVRRLPELAGFSGELSSAVLRRSVDKVAICLTERLPALRALRSQAIHGDCHAENLLVDGDAGSVSGVLDFGDMIHAPLIFEPAIAMSELLTGAIAPLDSLSEVLRGYAQDRQLQAGEVDMLFDLIAARHAVTILVHAWRSRHDPKGARALEEAAANAGGSLESLLNKGRGALTDVWHEAAGTRRVEYAASASAAPAALAIRARRARLLGVGAELFYEQPLHIVRGEGVWLYDAAGRPYLDVYNNVPHVGHAHPAVVQAIQRQTATLATHTRYLHERILEYAERLTAKLPPHLDTCMFVNSGSEANDVAWRIAQLATGNKGGLVMEYAYHGITDAVAALTPSTAGQSQKPHVATLKAPPSNLRAHDTMDPKELAAALEDADQAIGLLRARGIAPAAFFVDTALTSSGICDPPSAWASAVAARVRAAGGLLVADEVQYGLGRSGSNFWGFERRGLHPDIVTMGKPVGNGYPLGIVVANRRLVEAFQAKFGFFSTFGGNAVAAAAGLAVLDVLEREQLMANAHDTGRYLTQRLETLSVRHECLGAARGAGLLQGLGILGSDAHAAKLRAKKIVNTLASQYRVLIGTEGPEGNVLKLRPPMPFRPEHADLLIEAIDAAAALAS
jgi:4-aminobutyrate aminotransferase-like enzyme/Ser/Thr protein kinase RdoA (MazF antagonist)